MTYEITYLEFRINKNGVNYFPEKVADLLSAETPKNTMQLSLLNRVPCVPYVPVWSTCLRANVPKCQ